MKISESNRKIVGVIFALMVLVGMSWGIFTLAQVFWSAFSQLNPTVAAGIVAAVTTVLVSVISVLYSKHLEQKLNIQKEHREKKIPVYEELIAFIVRVIYAQKEGQEPLSEKEIVETYVHVAQKAVIWASDDVVKALHLFRATSLAEHKNYIPLAFAVEGLFLAIRNDLGHENKGVDQKQLLGMFINDLHKLTKP